jgi:hypothetical protein
MKELQSGTEYLVANTLREVNTNKNRDTKMQEEFLTQQEKPP